MKHCLCSHQMKRHDGLYQRNSTTAPQTAHCRDCTYGGFLPKEKGVVTNPPYRFRVDRLINGEGYVIVDEQYQLPMIGPFPLTRAGRERAIARAAEFEDEFTSEELGE